MDRGSPTLAPGEDWERTLQRRQARLTWMWEWKEIRGQQKGGVEWGNSIKTSQGGRKEVEGSIVLLMKTQRKLKRSS